MSRGKKAESSEPVIQPSISFIGDSKKHALQELFDGEGDLPTIKSVGFMKVPGTNAYVSFVMETKGYEVVKIAVEEPNLRAIAEESAKVSFVQSFIDHEEF